MWHERNRVCIAYRYSFRRAAAEGLRTGTELYASLVMQIKINGLALFMKVQLLRDLGLSASKSQ